MEPLESQSALSRDARDALAAALQTRADLRAMVDRHRWLASPAALFDVLTSPRLQHRRGVVGALFDVVGLPAQRPAVPLADGDWLLVRALGEGRLGWLFVVDDAAPPGHPPGVVVVRRAGARGPRCVLRAGGGLCPDTLVLRLRGDAAPAPYALRGERAPEARGFDDDLGAGGEPSGDDGLEAVPKPAVLLESIQIAYFGIVPLPRNLDAHAIYLAADTHPMLPGVSLDWWARGDKIIDPEWVRGRTDDQNKRAMLTRKKPVRLRVELKCSTTTALKGTLTATPTLDGSTKILTAATVSFTYPANASEYKVYVKLGSVMPDEVGRFRLDIAWEATGADFEFTKQTTTHYVYAAYDQPLEPDYDSPADVDPGTPTSRVDGTLTGTRKRLDKFTELLGPTRRHSVATADDLIELLWKLHVGINDTPGAPPYFDAAHDRHLTRDGERTGTKLPVDDQWLAWLVTKAPYWNDASCIGHVQLLKTMAAAVGIFVRRTWVFPTTTRMPDGSTVTPSDTDCYCLGTYDTSKVQTWTFTHNGVSYAASPKLMEPGTAWENFEACMRTSQGRFLTGGYATSSNPASFTKDRGFKSAKELLRWWSNTKRPSFGKRFMAWVYFNEPTSEMHVWDVNGKHYDWNEYVKVRDTGKELPPP